MTKIFLTCDPHIGKSTLLAKVVSKLPSKQGFLTSEILRNNERIGFKLVSSEGKKVGFATIDTDSDIKVSKYGVDMDALDSFISHLPPISSNTVLYIDEVGQMQLYSEAFKQLVRQYLNAPNDFIGTLSKVYDNEFIDELKQRADIEIIEVTPDNRDSLVDALISKYVR